MTPAAELWAAVVKHCATGRGYDMDIRSGIVQVRFGVNGSMRCRVVESYIYKWSLERHDEHWTFPTADEAVRAALRIVAPNTEPNVSC